MTRRLEEGSGTIAGLGVIAAILLTFMVLATISQVYLGHQRAQMAADLGALAGAGSSPSALLAGQGDGPCAVATTVVAANGADVTDCWADAGDLRLVVRTPVRLLPGWQVQLPARARAGPTY